MVEVRYMGLGSPEAALGDFQSLVPDIQRLARLQRCAGRADALAVDMAFKGLETTAYHFTRRPHFYDACLADVRRGATPSRSSDEPATSLVEALRPIWDRLGRLQDRCRPFGRDYLALEIAKHSLTSAAYHFTGVDGYFTARAHGPA